MRVELLKDSVDSFILEEQEDEKAINTTKHYRHVIELFLSKLSKEIIQKKDVIEFKQWMQTKFKPKTVNNYIVIVNKFLKYCSIIDAGYPYRIARTAEYIKLATNGDIEDLTVKNIKLQNKASLEEVLEPIDLKRLLRWAKKMGKMDIYYIMKIIAYTGIRVEELKIFTVENIKSNYIEVNNKGKIRNVILSKQLRRELVAYCKEHKIKSGYIFLSHKKQDAMMCSSTIFRQMKKIAKAARVKEAKVHAHSFRHLFAIKYMDEHGDLTELADILGHSSIETTRIYTKTTDEMKRKKLEKLKY